MFWCDSILCYFNGWLWWMHEWIAIFHVLLMSKLQTLTFASAPFIELNSFRRIGFDFFRHIAYRIPLPCAKLRKGQGTVRSYISSGSIVLVVSFTKFGISKKIKNAWKNIISSKDDEKKICDITFVSILFQFAKWNDFQCWHISVLCYNAWTQFVSQRIIEPKKPLTF